MKIIISPAKKMNIDSDTFAAEGTPVFIKDAKLLRNAVRALTFQETKALWKCNDQLARLNYERFQHMVPERGLTPAIMSYEGLQYQYMAPGDRFLTVDFGELAGKRVKQKGTLAKMARGRMVRFLAENGIENPEQMKEFREMGFSFRGELSGKEKYVFVREESSRQ